MSPEDLFLENLGLIERVIAHSCRRYRFRREDCEDFGSIVKMKLIADDYGVFRKFQNRSTIKTYVTVVVNRQLLDHLDHLWGKWRPSAEARRLGPVAEQLERLLRDGLTLDDACENLRANFHVKESRDEVNRIAARLPHRLPRRIVEGEDQLATLQAPDGSPEQSLREQERAALRARADRALAQACARLKKEDRVILSMQQGGATVAQIARALRLDQKRLYRRITKILAALRRALEREGLNRDDIRDMLGDD